LAGCSCVRVRQHENKKIDLDQSERTTQGSGTCARSRGNRSQVQETKSTENQIDTAKKFGMKISDLETRTAQQKTREFFHTNSN
jgi:hypothetical protein